MSFAPPEVASQEAFRSCTSKYTWRSLMPPEAGLYELPGEIVKFFQTGKLRCSGNEVPRRNGHCHYESEAVASRDRQASVG